ncbi:serine/threonine-protein phosphatase family protein [Grosmannia clavigera kw1407]|uniref:Serine/threonine-protein phosphatase family protein n=1 Tax=Grosmannia clavigera (strain kw1407 / UAMH 11150) TaxID=655863 RepID=F0XMF9_GROCL|nr:serine/threonine-protein phosphatase family protein [Grosmannia clavigera kw1407]EFX01244.1 serine/threonine-protein phosphatase family protein [Grosmannia clavigera kw1407]
MQLLGPTTVSTSPRLPPLMRRTRIVCISDTHNSRVKLPKGDVLIHAGDLTNQGSYSEITRAVAWLEEAPFECKIVVAGNHDITLDRAFYAQHNRRFHNQSPQPTDECLALLTASPSITYLSHGSASVFLKAAGGPHTQFTVFGSPYSPRDGTSSWAFQYDRMGTSMSGSSLSFPAGPGTVPYADDSAAAVGVWSAIPATADIVVTHTPPFGHCDWSTARDRAMGCEGLRRALWQTRPRLVVCGHVHEGRGVERVRWSSEGEQGSADGAGGEVAVDSWQDPGRDGGKLSIVDLTTRGTRHSLDDGTAGQASEGRWTQAGDGKGRRESCIVNCAITATNYPHVGGKRLNKPVVVDLDLPVWEEPG